MPPASLQTTIASFVEYLTAAKGYSAHTCRAYARDLEEFARYVDHRREPEPEPQSDTDGAVNAGQVDTLMIRGYLGWLHKKNKKVTTRGTIYTSMKLLMAEINSGLMWVAMNSFLLERVVMVEIKPVIKKVAITKRPIMKSKLNSLTRRTRKCFSDRLDLRSM